MRDNKRRLQTDDLSKIKKKLGLSSMDSQWLLAITPATARNLREKEFIEPVSREILIKYLLTYPHLSPLPEEPDFHELWDELSQTRIGEEMGLKVSHIAPLFGVGSSNGHAWKSGSAVSTLILRLFMMLMKALEEEGEAGFKNYLKLIDDVAKAHGFADHRAIIANGGWR